MSLSGCGWYCSGRCPAVGSRHAQAQAFELELIRLRDSLSLSVWAPTAAEPAPQSSCSPPVSLYSAAMAVEGELQLRLLSLQYNATLNAPHYSVAGTDSASE